MKILIVGSEKSWSIEKYYCRYLSDCCTVELFAAQNLLYDYLSKGYQQKILHRLGLSHIYKTINEQLKKIIERFQPDVIFVFKGMEILPSSLIWAKAKGIKLVNYNPDNPFLFSGRGSGNANVSESISLYDLHFTYDRAIKKRLTEQFNKPTMILPFGFDVSEDVYRVSAERPEITKVCFLGNPDTFRVSFIQQLAQSGIHLDVFGNSWEKHVRHSNITCKGPVSGEDVWYTLRQYRVQLNLMRPHNPHSHNMRTFEIAGIGGIQLAPDTEDHRHYFVSEKEIFLFGDVYSCINQAQKLLSLGKEKADNIRSVARQKSLVGRYHYEGRAGLVREALVNLECGKKLSLFIL